VTQITSYRDIKKIPIGSLLIIYERFGAPHIERLILKRFEKGGFIAAPQDDIAKDRYYRCDAESFSASNKGFSLLTPLGKVAVRFEVVPANQ